MLLFSRLLYLIEEGIDRLVDTKVRFERFILYVGTSLTLTQYRLQPEILQYQLIVMESSIQ